MLLNGLLVTPALVWLWRPSVPRVIALAAALALLLSPATYLADPWELARFNCLIGGLIVLGAAAEKRSLELLAGSLVLLLTAMFIRPNADAIALLLVPSLWVAFGRGRLSLILTALAIGLFTLSYFDLARLWQSLWRARSECWTYPLMVLPFLFACMRWRRGWRRHPLYVFALLFPAYLALSIYNGNYESSAGFFVLFMLFAAVARNLTQEEADPSWLSALSAVALLVGALASRYYGLS